MSVTISYNVTHYMKRGVTVGALREIIQDLAAMSQRGAITEEELSRILGYLVQRSPAQQTSESDGRSEVGTTLGDSPISSPPVALSSTRPRRRNLGRGSHGWVDLHKRARDLALVGLLEVGGHGSRSRVLDHIERRWGRHFTDADREILRVAREPRWRKICNWAFHYSFRDGLVERPERGVQSLTTAGRREAEARRKTLPT